MGAAIHALRARHERGIYSVACYEEAIEHYGEPDHLLWKVGCYLLGVFGR